MTDVDKTIFEREFRTRVSELQGLGKKRIAVLVNGGSFNPIHNGHLEMYVVARNELITERELFDEVLIIYCASKFDHVYKKIKGGPFVENDRPYLKEYTQQIFDKSGTKDRIKICREAFASIDNILNSGKSSDGKHLSKNMFVWYEESHNPYSNGIKNSAHGTGIIFYGLSGSDYATDSHFTDGINDHSIMVSRNPALAGPTGFNTDQKIYITTSSNIDTASSTIRPDLQKLRNFIETATEQQVNKFIAAKGSKEAAAAAADKPVAAADVEPSAKSVTPYDAAVATIRLLKSVPNSILFRLLTYHEIPRFTASGNPEKYGKYKWGYMQFRKLLFQQKIKGLNPGVKQRSHEITSDTTAKELLSNDEYVEKLAKLPDDNKQNPPTIEFLQMSTAHALSLEKNTGISASALNFANANSVGGGVLGGSTVQEETLCMMAPELYVSLIKAVGGTEYRSAWGDTNWDTKFYYSEEPINVPFKTTDEFTFSTAISPEFAKQYTGHIISAAAYNWRHRSRISAQTKDIRAKMIKCIKNMAAVAAVKQNCDVLILGAWGCGAFAPHDKENYIKDVAGMFCEALYSPIDVGDSPLKYKDLFKKVIFPIPDCYTYDIFKSAFDEAETPKKIAAVAAEAKTITAAVPAKSARPAVAAAAVAPKVAVAGNPTPGVNIAEKIAKYNDIDPNKVGATIEDFLGAHLNGFNNGIECSSFRTAIDNLKLTNKKPPLHWMWYIIPVPNGFSQTAMFFKVNGDTNVKPDDFMSNPTLRQHYVAMIKQIWECVKILDAAAAEKNVMSSIFDVMGKDDRPKLLSSAITFKPIIDANNFQDFDTYFKTIISALSYLNSNKGDVLSVDALLKKTGPAITTATPAAAAAAAGPAAAGPAAAARPAAPSSSSSSSSSAAPIAAAAAAAGPSAVEPRPSSLSEIPVDPAPITAPAAPSSSTPLPVATAAAAAAIIPVPAASLAPATTTTSTAASALPSKAAAAAAAASTVAVPAAVAAVPVKPAVAPLPAVAAPRPTSAPDNLIEFVSEDPWTFYRCLMRGYMMAVIDSPPANAVPKTSDTANQRNRLTFDTKKSILDSDNLFYFDDFTITECDIIIGMVTRLSKWIKIKLENDAPRQYFTSLADQTALLSNADFFVHQLELAFKDSKHIMSSSTTPTGDAASVEPKNETEFLDKLTDYSYNNTGTSKVFAKYDAAKRSVKNATRKTRDAISRAPGAVKSAASAKWELTKTGTRNMWTRRVTVPIEDMKYAKADRAIENADTNKKDAERVKAEIEETRKKRVQAGGAQQSFNIDIMAPLKKYKEEKLGKIIEMSDPSMRVENYFELMTKMITTKNAKGEEQVVPAIFGHPLLLYLPFARAFMCGINVYTEAESGAGEKYTLKYSVPSYYEWEKNQNMPIIHLLDKNKIDDPDFLNATNYSSNFSLLYKK
jgi:uncharacterized protein (TIGR02452 family)